MGCSVMEWDEVVWRGPFDRIPSGRGGVLLAAPLEGVGTIEPPDGRAGAGNAPVGAHFGALLPAVANTWRWVVEKDHELVEVGRILRPGRVLQPVQEGIQTGNGEGRRLGDSLFHGCDPNASGKGALALHALYGLDGHVSLKVVPFLVPPWPRKTKKLLGPVFLSPRGS